MNFSNSGHSFPFIPRGVVLCLRLCSLKKQNKKTLDFFCCFLVPNQFHLKPAPSHPPPPLRVPSFALCGSQLREVFNPAFERSARQKRGRGTAILSLSSLSSGVPLLRLLTLFKAALFFSFHLFFFFPSCLGSLFFLFLACGIVLALPSAGRRVKYPSSVNFRRGELSLSLYGSVSLPDF